MWDLVLKLSVITFFIGAFSLAFLYRYGRRNHDDWHNRDNMAEVKPLPFFGSILENLEKIKLQLLSILVGFSTFLEVSISIPILASKPKPVDLEFICTEVSDPRNKEFIPDDVPVILLHGLTRNKENWSSFLEIIALETKKKVYSVDLRNHGQSPWNDKEYDVVAMTEDIKHLIDRIKAPKAIILGHSLGGKIAVHLALNYPEKVEKVIVVDMRPNGLTPEVLKGVQMWSRILKDQENFIPQGVSEKEAKEEVIKPLNDHLAKLNMTYQLNDPNLVPVKCSKGKCQLNTNPVLMDAILRNYTDLFNESSGHFDGPALFYYGAESDFRVGEDESNIKKMFPNAKLVPEEGADHYLFTFKKLGSEVIKFINSK